MRFTVRTYTLLLATGLLASAVACGGSSNSNPTSPSPPASSADVTVGIVGDRASQSYSPSPVTMRVGQTIAWHNNDSITHTATQDAGTFNTGNLAAGATSAPVTMSTAGTFTYHCTIHPGMVGTVTVQ
ncbi:MAG: plastocyanin/azurin family copper-binding protein [Betaproteobacteria bacterium]